MREVGREGRQKAEELWNDEDEERKSGGNVEARWRKCVGGVEVGGKRERVVREKYETRENE